MDILYEKARATYEWPHTQFNLVQHTAKPPYSSKFRAQANVEHWESVRKAKYAVHAMKQWSFLFLGSELKVARWCQLSALSMKLAHFLTPPNCFETVSILLAQTGKMGARETLFPVKRSDWWSSIRPFAQLLPGLEMGHPVTFGHSAAYESHSEQSETETRKTPFCSSETLKSFAGDWPAVTGCPVSNPGYNCANGLFDLGTVGVFWQATQRDQAYYKAYYRHTTGILAYWHTTGIL